MTNKDYLNRVDRLKEIEVIARNPGTSLDIIEELMEETRKIVAECYGYTRGLREKVESLNSQEPVLK